MIDSIISIIVLGSMISFMYMLLSTGFTLIYSVSNILDLSYPAFLMIAGYTYFSLCPFVPPIFALMISMVITAILYVLMFRLVIKRFLNDLVTTAVITCLCSLVVEYVLVLTFSRLKKSLFSFVPGVVRIHGTAVSTHMIVVAIMSAIIMVGLWAFLKLTFLGRAIRALSMDKKGATLAGVDLDKVLTVVYLIAGLMAGLAGISYGVYTALSPDMWMYPLIVILAVTLVGGLGSIRGAIIVSIILGFLEMVTIYLWDPRARGISVMLSILLILYLRPCGLFGREAKL